jgi:Protein of unknown function (DUF3293).
MGVREGRCELITAPPGEQRVSGQAHTEIAPEVVRAYLDAEYHVCGPAPFTLRIGEFSPQLREAQSRQGVSCSAFITACNPRGVLSNTVSNAGRQAQLADALQKIGLVYWPGIGRDPAGEWSGEESYLIFGMALRDAKFLGREYDQNAIVWNNEEAIPKLILLR